MPYTIKKRGTKYLIVKKRTGKVVGRSASKRKALASIAYREGYDKQKGKK